MRYFVIENSTSIAGIGHNSAKKWLVVEFKDGRTYLYKDFPEEKFEEFLIWPSHGQYFNAHIRDKYEFEEITLEREEDESKLQAQEGEDDS
jgi:lysyl-tRNA synthetase class 2